MIAAASVYWFVFKEDNEDSTPTPGGIGGGIEGGGGGGGNESGGGGWSGRTWIDNGIGVIQSANTKSVST